MRLARVAPIPLLALMLAGCSMGTEPLPYTNDKPQSTLSEDELFLMQYEGSDSFVVSEEDRHDALWYARAMKYDEMHSQGITGKGVTIAVLDNGINLQAAELQGADIKVVNAQLDYYTDEPINADSKRLIQAHGTAVTAVLVGNGVASDGGLGTRGIAPDAKILFYNASLNCVELDTMCLNNIPEEATRYVGDPQQWAAASMVHAIQSGADIVSISFIEEWEFGVEWQSALAYAHENEVPVVCGLPNPVIDAEALSSETMSVPCPLNGTIPVNLLDKNGNPGSLSGDPNSPIVGQGKGMGQSNTAIAAPGAFVLSTSFLDRDNLSGFWGPDINGFGTSLATPMVAGALALSMQAHPDAQPYQHVQQMLHTTGSSTHDMEWVDRWWGYGILNPMAMISADPSVYPNENPLLIRSLDDPRCGTMEDGSSITEMSECIFAPRGPSVEEYAALVSGFDSLSDADSLDGPENAQVQTNGTVQLMEILIVVTLIMVGLLVVGASVLIPLLISRSRKRQQVKMSHEQH